MKYKHLDITYFFSFIWFKRTENIKGVCLGTVGKGTQCQSIHELEKNVLIWQKKLQCYMCYIKYCDIWCILSEVVFISNRTYNEYYYDYWSCRQINIEQLTLFSWFTFIPLQSSLKATILPGPDLLSWPLH